MKKTFACILTLVFSCSLISCGFLHKNQEKTNINDLKQNESSENLNSEYIISTLTSDEFEGRLVGSNGNKLTEDFINNLFNEIKLEKIFNNNDYKHTYTQEVTDTYGLQDSNSKIEEKEVNNIVGKISGENSKNALIISAHFDHIGKQDGQIIRGAIDNASGVAVLINLAEKLKLEYNINPPKFDIIFCAFNGEEKGLEGSSNFVKDIKNKYENLVNINIDCVGYKNGGNIIFLGANFETKDIVQKKLYETMEESLNKNNLEISQNDLKGVSDSISFACENIPNICLIEENIKEVINSPRDTIDVVDFERLDSIVKSIIYFIDLYSKF